MRNFKRRERELDKIRKSLNTNNSAFSMVSISCSLVARFHQIFFKTAPRIATKIPICHTAIRLKVSIWVLSSTSSAFSPLCPLPNKVLSRTSRRFSIFRLLAHLPMLKAFRVIPAPMYAEMRFAISSFQTSAR